MNDVLITGTTSGIGKALAETYRARGGRVIEVNRATIDIADYAAVTKFLADLPTEPDLLVLNAGINLPDNADGLDYPAFARVMRTNLDGVMTFVGAIHELGWRGKTIAALSSTSNIVPNSGHLGYYVSKLAIDEAFRILARRDRGNRYKSVVLGPVHTGITRGYAGPTGMNRRLFDLLALDAPGTAARLARFFDGPGERLRHPKGAVAFYYAVRALLKVAPGLYP